MVVYITNSFGKSHNSTKQINYSSMTAYNNVRLKEQTTIVNPVIELSNFISGACYAYIPSFGRYYFITNIESVSNNIFRYYMAVDTMGTFKSNILSTSQYCSRSSAGNVALIDDLITHTEQAPTNSYMPVDFGMQGGTYVLEVVGKNGVNLYTITFETLNSLIVNLFNADFYGENVVDDTIKTYFNPFQYILSCRWYPFTFSGSPTNISFGWWDSTISGGKLPGPGTSGQSWLSANFTVPKIDNTNNFYNKDSRWIRHNLFIPGCGDVEIPSIASGELLNVYINCDYWTGQANAGVRYPGGATIARLSGQLGVDVRISNLASDMSNLGSTILMGQENTQNKVTDTLLGIGKSIGNALLGGVFNAADAIIPGHPIKSALQPNLSYTTASGNCRFLADHRSGLLSTTYFTPHNTESVHNKFNYPDNTYHSLSNLSGYTVCESPKIDFSCTSEEKNIITSFMRGGFYIE